MLYSEVNFVAVLVAAIATIILASLWYSPALFGKQWMKLMKITDADIKKAKEKGMGKSYLVAFIASLIMADVLAQFAGALALSGAKEIITLAFWIWLGFVATVMVNSVLWEGRAPKLFAINAAYWLVALVIMSLVLSAF